VGAKAIALGPTVFIGDSWGAIAAFAAAHELSACCGWTPTHVLVSGNASPRATSTHNGLGSYSSKRMASLTDSDLVGFLLASSADEGSTSVGSDHEDTKAGDAEEGAGSNSDDGGSQPVKSFDSELISAFRADCQLYEDYTRPSDLPMLPSQLCVLRGANDSVVSLDEAWGWVSEFSCEEAKIVRVSDATHHVHEEQPKAVAAHLLAFIGHSSDVNKRAIGDNALAMGAFNRRSILPPPCDFIRGIDEELLRSFREGNLLYRSGSPHGSKGELAGLLEKRKAGPEAELTHKLGRLNL
jgi:surfactin synthase thioesterase subunit